MENKLASLGATLVRNSAHLLTYLLTHSLTGVKCRATSVAKNGELGGVNRSYLSVCVCVVNLFIKNIMFFKGWLP